MKVKAKMKVYLKCKSIDGTRSVCYDNATIRELNSHLTDDYSFFPLSLASCNFVDSIMTITIRTLWNGWIQSRTDYNEPTHLFYNTSLGFGSL